MLLDVIFDLDIKLDETVHCDSHRSTLNNQDLDGSNQLAKPCFMCPLNGNTYPDMRKGRIERALAVQAKMLGHDRNDSHEHPQKTVLEDADPNDLHQNQPLFTIPPSCKIDLTLNQVSPLRGILQIPCSPPQHFCIQFNGHTHCFGLIPRK